jgi:hypothetical protein
MTRLGGPWTGPGRALVEDAKELRYGRLPQPAGCSIAGDRTLPDLMAFAVRTTAGADAALVPASFLATQPAIDGFTAWIPAGVVDELAIQRLAPYPDDQIYACNVTRQEWGDLIREFTAPALGSPGVANHGENWWQYLAGRSVVSKTPTELRLAVPAPWHEPVEQILHRPMAWSTVGAGLKQALRMNLSAGGERP